MIRFSKPKTVVLLVLSLILVYLHLYSGNRMDREKQVVQKTVEQYEQSSKIIIDDRDTAKKLILNSETDVIRREISHQNEILKIKNLEKFDPLNPETSIVVIQVHSRIEALAFVIESLSKVQHIENSLLIFSHDIFDPLMCEMIGKIDFARMTQIFYPHSVQLHPNSFPGPDTFFNGTQSHVGANQREPGIVQAKHHWWWKANFVFEKMAVLRPHAGIIIFIEEDHYLSPDFLWVAKLMEGEMKENRCHGCHLLALGEVMTSWNIAVGSSATQSFVTSWKQHGTGMAFNRTLWGHLKDCASTFCTYDDYNWDWSLTRVSYVCFNMLVNVPVAPRIFHFGTCGMHHKNKICDFETPVRVIQGNIKKHAQLLFPGTLALQNRVGNPFPAAQGYGGWSDKRDHDLCMKIVS